MMSEKEEIGIKLGIDATPETIDFIHHLEKVVDEALNKEGFTRKGTIKRKGYTVLNYRQFAICGSKEADHD
jgi:hypothetical protein